MVNQPIEPGLLLRSFLTVGSAYVLIWICFFVIITSLALLFYPQYVKFIELDPAAQQELMARNPQEAIPLSMFCIMVVLNFLCCIVVGWIVGKTAPFSHFAHGIFLSVLVFVMFLQIVISDPQAKKWMDIVYMGALPIGVLIGARKAAPLNQEPAGE
jgi:uncharacterized membrane protein YbjE (DUF340 family)